MPTRLLVAVLLLAALPAHSAEKWKIRQFEVVAVEPLRAAPDLSPAPGGLEYMAEDFAALLIRLSRVVGTDFEAAGLRTVELNPEAKALAESIFIKTAIELERWGFPEPDLQPVVTRTDGSRAYRVYVLGSDNALIPPQSSGTYHNSGCIAGVDRPQESIIVLDASAVFEGVPGESAQPGWLWERSTH